MTNWKLSYFLVAIAISISPAYAKTFTECGCDRFLANGLFQTKSDVATETVQTAFKGFLCTASQEEINRVSSDRTNLGFEVPDYIDFDFGKSGDENYVRQWRSSSCSAEDSTQDSESVFQSIRVIADRRIIDGANRCYETCQGGGLFCDMARLDADTLLFTTNWTPQTTQTAFPKITGGGIKGGRISDIGAFGESPIRNEMEITVTGVSATIDADEPASPVTIRIDTDQAGSCSAATEGLTVKYRIDTVIEGTGSVPRSVSQSQRHAIGNSGSCTEHNVNGSWPICLPIGARITDHNIQIHSIARGRAWAELGNPTANCAMLRLNYSDGGRRTFGDCRGNGWADATLSVTGTVNEDAAIERHTETKSIELPYGEGSQVTFQYPTDKLAGISSVNWIYRVTVREERLDDTITHELSNAAGTFDRFVSTITPQGTLSLGITRE